ncbi:MAG: hypothetical protein M3447_11060, partial [Acidobacteriota bacterium]|nr:hypothetical protein [Acidobacteriota bacterium]
STLSLCGFGVWNASAQNQSTALERGYRTGYSDGYNAGYKDLSDRVPRDFQNKAEYQQANRSYNQTWGTPEDYRDGYQQGYEAGYLSGYDGQAFNSSIPTGLSRRGADQQRDPQPVQPQADPDGDEAIVNRSGSSNSYPTTSVSPSSGPLLIPRDTFLIVEMESSLSTEASQRGDRFQARVIEPSEFQGAIIEGRVTRVKRPGRVKGVAELQLSFEQIRMPDNRSSSIGAEVVEVVPTGRSDEGEVDSEGGVRGKDSTKDDVAKVGAATGIGAILGAIAGGGKGAAIGAAIGGSVGAGGVLSKRGKDIRLERGQQLKLRTSSDARFQ